MDAEAEAPVLWTPDAKNWLMGKYPDAGKDWGQEKGMTEGEMIGRHHRLDGHEFQQAAGYDEGQGSLVRRGLWDRRELDMTERLNDNSNSGLTCPKKLFLMLQAAFGASSPGTFTDCHLFQA